ncbi:hypothetical protein [Agromyces humi]|uniref:hypothetical protein n=1 Tax=Agromyces humi TaxID=1766800 RepID=UPI00135CBBC8|nr:hypothetical protein [Agromyces humi]
MNVRAFLIAPAVVAVAVLAGCGLTDGTDAKAGSARVGIHSSEVCHAPAYIRDRAPAGVCSDADAETDADEPEVVDDLSPLQGDR